MATGEEIRPRRRDAAASRERLLTAAAAEFVAHGVAGARVDRIAAAAGANQRLIYDYFGDKDALFDAVLDRFTEEAVGAVPIDADDLPAYAGRLFDYHCDNPDLLRLVTISGDPAADSRAAVAVVDPLVAGLEVNGDAADAEARAPPP